MPDINTEIKNLSSVGQTMAKRLRYLGLETVRDLFYFYPFRYDDFSETNKISDLKPLTSTNIVGYIELIQNKRSPRKRMSITEALVGDDSGQIKVIWFNQPFIAKNLKPGDKVSLAGKVDHDYSGLIMKSPVYEKVSNTSSTHTQGLIPVYHSTANLTQKQIRYIIKQSMAYTDFLDDWMPDYIIKKNRLLTLRESIYKIHFPETQNDIDEAKKRLSFNELFLTQLQSQLIKREMQTNEAQSIEFMEKEIQEFVKSLPFTLTDDQKKSAWQIIQDMEKDRPMSRLLEGDVGSGKTLVAVIAMLNAAMNPKINAQSVIMVPTELLAQQHYNEICKLLKNNIIKIGLITRSNKKANYTKKQKLNASEIAKESQIIIGTHALIQEKVEFSNLCLTIIDEQHRFGVEQRKAIINKSGNAKTTPHLLSMTATPIPRTLALVIYGDLDISIIRQMPKGRKTIITEAISNKQRLQTYNFIKKQINEGRQAFVICPLIDVSDKLGVASVTEEFKKLNEKIFPELDVAMLHGKLKAKEKEEIMKNFQENKTKILVSTSVIEVGIDIPNSTIMMIEGADRFGLAQLHQFRGRVGRGEHQSYCYLFTESNSDKTMERLNALVQYSDGLSLAKTDLKLRGPGEVYGTSQKGFPELKMANLFDHELVKVSNYEAIELLKKDPELDNTPSLKHRLDEWSKKVHLE